MVLFCPAITWDSSARAASTPGDGIWLHDVFGEVSGDLTHRGPFNVTTRRIGGVTASISWPVRLSGSGSTTVTLRAGTSVATLELGLGLKAAVAEGILGSTRLHT